MTPSHAQVTGKLKSLKHRMLAAGMLTGRQIGAQLGVSRTTLGKLRNQGRSDPERKDRPNNAAEAETQFWDGCGSF